MTQRQERVYDLYAATLDCNRDEFEAMGRSLHRGASKGQRAEIARFHSNLQGQWVWGRPVRGARLGAVCVVANPRNSGATAAVLRLASHPAKSLSRREEIATTFLLQGLQTGNQPAARAILWLGHVPYFAEGAWARIRFFADHAGELNTGHVGIV